MKRFLSPTLLLLLALTSPVRGQILYLASGGSGTNASLYTVNPATAGTTFIADILVGADNVGMTGLAFQPGTGALYGVTSNGNNHARSLVLINPVSGAATVVGGIDDVLGGTVSDITFNQAGTVLFGYMANGSAIANRVVTINLTTGVATSFGSVNGITTGGSIAIDPTSGVAYVSRSSTNGTLDTFLPANGNLITGATLTGAHFSGTSLGAMAINDSGGIFTINLTGGSAWLMTLTAGGTLTGVGALPNYSDSLAFSTTAIPEPSLYAAVAGAMALGLAAWRRRTMTHPRI